MVHLINTYQIKSFPVGDIFSCCNMLSFFYVGGNKISLQQFIMHKAFLVPLIIIMALQYKSHLCSRVASVSLQSRVWAAIVRGKNPEMTFPIKNRIKTELFIDRTAALYITETRMRENELKWV